MVSPRLGLFPQPDSGPFRADRKVVVIELEHRQSPADLNVAYFSTPTPPRHARPCAGHPRLSSREDVDDRDIGERSDAVLWTAKPGHDVDECLSIEYSPAPGG